MKANVLPEQKQTNTQRMVATVNEVKKLEVELDRAGQNLSQVQQKYNEQEEAVSVSGGGGGAMTFR